MTDRVVTGGTAGPPARWPALDGLRAVAVLLVVGYHASGVIGHGALGVDVFFVLSGFLITNILAAEVQRTGRPNLGRFYRKRVLRLAPALIVMCGVLVVLSVVTGRQTSAVAQGAAASVFYVANLWLFTGHDMPLLQHMWTLALESQFYLVWPLLVGLVLRRRRAGVGILLACLAFALATELGGLGPVAFSYARAAGLPFGCGLALALRRPSSPWSARFAAAGGAALALLVALALIPRDEAPALNAGLAILPSVLALPVVACLTRPGRWADVLSHPAATWLGARSYSLYLWHLPVLSVLINQVPVAALPVRLLAGVVVSVALADLSYRFIELPFIRRGRRAAVGAPPAAS